jgi:hypothetical protein
MNTATALTQQQINMVNQVTPDGNLTYSQSGNSFIPDANGQQYYVDSSGQYHSSLPTRSVTTPGSSSAASSSGRYDKNGQWVPDNPGKTTAASTSDQSYTPDGWSSVKGSYIPTYTATQTLSPQQQAIKDQTDAASLNLGKLANQQSAAISDQLSKPFSYDPFKYTTSDAENYAYDLGKKRLDPQFTQGQDALRSQLIASGLRPGSEAYDQQLQQFGQTKNDAYDQLALGSQQQGYNQALGAYQQNYQGALTQYNEPLNAISALMSGSQVQNPTFTNTPQSNVAGVDYSGLVNNNYNAQTQQYQAQVGQQNAMMGGLFGLAGSGITAGIKYSDRRLKSDIRRVGILDNGLPIYSYRLNGSPVTEIGVMADEVEAVNPHAVFEQPDGYKMVDYRMATEAA